MLWALILLFLKYLPPVRWIYDHQCIMVIYYVQLIWSLLLVLFPLWIMPFRWGFNWVEWYSILFYEETWKVLVDECYLFISFLVFHAMLITFSWNTAPLPLSYPSFFWIKLNAIYIINICSIVMSKRVYFTE